MQDEAKQKLRKYGIIEKRNLYFNVTKARWVESYFHFLNPRAFHTFTSTCLPYFSYQRAFPYFHINVPSILFISSCLPYFHINVPSILFISSCLPYFHINVPSILFLFVLFMIKRYSLVSGDPSSEQYCPIPITELWFWAHVDVLGKSRSDLAIFPIIHMYTITRQFESFRISNNIDLMPNSGWVPYVVWC